MNQPFVTTEKVRFQHVDYAGIVFYPRFLEMLNGLVEDWFAEALDRPFHQMHQTNGIPTVDLKIQFKNAARLGQILTKKLWVKNIGFASLLCGFEFTDDEGKTTLSGEITLVNVAFNQDRDGIKAEPFNDEIKSKIQKYLIE
ncbi:acyl-CoA thioesterase [Flavobacterium sp. CYK-55]|uniref:acyl-CoA thioesterase n=1 Tax=Flavobacterium sp. CYK-55 TaxID=2835529 RepID=UPI001BCF08F3|nr:thioesterase family protein [Flavobacterium sp. CYK-55]MBS7786839.1 acyl-CoA thioesterase [Flavobacterium sp. CYK-55]